MAVNKPVGDKARKGAVKKRTQLKSKLGGATRLDQAQQDLWRVHRREETRRRQKSRQEIQGRAA